ncbi:PKD-like family lipoprotein [Pedobacter sp. R-06]|uniref:PKD-like family lipoprotein n=1 Tax=Pedobacter sp. R-06 TaxID=3404051 RepID=UPI003CEC2834
MRKILLHQLLVILFVSSLASCSKDIGNYTYHDINQITFTDLDTIKGYRVNYDDSLVLNPTLAMTKDDSHSIGDYIYEWSFRLPNKFGNTSDSVISVNKVLKIKVGVPPGTYPLQYRITDKKTGVQFHARTQLVVVSEIYEGYLVLNDVNGQSRLDMLSYNKADNSFRQFTDVLKKMGSTLPMQGKPYQVFCMDYTGTNITTQNYGVFVLNASGTSRIDQETFAYSPALNIRNLIVGNVPVNFTAQGLTGNLTAASFPLMVMYANDNVYMYSTLAGYAFKYTPINVYTPSGAPFRISPNIITNNDRRTVMYNMDKRSFVSAASYNSTSVTDIPTYPTGYDLVYMNRDYNNKAFAIMKDPATAKYRLLRFDIGGLVNDNIELGPEFANASHYALSPELGYIFYSVGGKVFEFDVSTKQSILMVDKGAAIITYLDFQYFYKRLATPSNNPNYKDWANLLTVGAYDPGAAPTESGTLELYSVPPVNGQIIKKNSWTGFGKIVSVCYRER